MAASDPNPSSQMRVGVTKYAPDGSVWVSSTELARDAAVTTTRPAAHHRTGRRRRPRNHSSAMSTGQNK
jgi:hypothetical protein